MERTMMQDGLSETIALDRVSLSVRRSGAKDGPSLVFVHGVMMSGRFFGKQIGAAELADFDVVVPDLRGHGDSEKTPAGHTVATYAQDLADLVDALDLRKPVLVGWSMGVMVVYEYLKLRGQDSVSGIVVVEQTPSDYLWEGYTFGFVTLSSLAELVTEIQTDLPALAHQLVQLMLHEPTPEADQWMSEEITKVPPTIASTIFVNQTIRDDRGFIGSITVPTLVLFGRDPKLTPPEAGQYITDHIQGARLQIFENSSHCPFFEEPDTFNRAVAEFAGSL
jgi:pimeloyl-ACP methyl ester carboxylesterase